MKSGIHNLIRGLCLCLLLLAGSVCADTTLRFYYFNPDAPQHNLERLKRDMETLLDKLGLAIEFQPFARLTDFNLGVHKDRPSFVFVPDWYLHSYGKALKLKPLLQAVRDRRQNYHKLLISARHSFEDLKESDRILLAMTSLGPDSMGVLSRIFPDEEALNINKIRIVEVPKDADAIFAAALNQVDVALVSQASLLHLQTINPRLIDSLQVLGKSKPLNMPVLGCLEDSASPEQQTIFRKFMMTTGSSQVMHALRIDGWSEHND